MPDEYQSDPLGEHISIFVITRISSRVCEYIIVRENSEEPYDEV